MTYIISAFRAWRLVATVGLLCLATPLAAQAPSATLAPAPALSLSLAEALKQARLTSPTLRQTLNDRAPATAGVRAAYGSLLPSVNVNGSMSYTGPGTQAFGGALFTPPGILGSSWALQAQWVVNGQRLLSPSQQKATSRATDAEIDQAELGLRTEVVTQYLTALQARAQVEVSRQQVTRNGEFLELAKARYQVGQATLLDVRQAEVTKGGSEVLLLRAVQSEAEAKLELFRRIGTPAPVLIDQVALSDSFPLAAPGESLDDLVARAERENPLLRSFRLREEAAAVGLRAARAEYTPTLTVAASVGGFTQQFTNTDGQIGSAFAQGQAGLARCQFDNQVRSGLGLGGLTPDCFAANGLLPDGSGLQPGIVDAINSRNSQWPFSFTRNPFQAFLQLSFPVFTGFQRTSRIAQAHAAQLDADERARAQALQVRTDVTARWLNTRTAWEIVAVQDRNRAAARDQLRLAQDRYRVGSGTALELADAANAVQRAEGDYVTAIYDYHRAVALLELAVGRPLRQPEGN